MNPPDRAAEDELRAILTEASALQPRFDTLAMHWESAVKSLDHTAEPLTLQQDLAGVLATICSDDKKLIHGMKDAVMTVCSERGPDSV